MRCLRSPEGTPSVAENLGLPTILGSWGIFALSVPMRSIMRF